MTGAGKKRGRCYGVPLSFLFVYVKQKGNPDKTLNKSNYNVLKGERADESNKGRYQLVGRRKCI